jgi:hypothetical protein
MVIYFSGHGFVLQSSEYWMLSDALEDPNAAISLDDSIVHARKSAIPNVVFISDACRSAPESLQLTQIHGSVIFPNIPVRPIPHVPK